MKISVFDSTLRDGAQAEGISFLVGDKIKIAQALDELGIQYIEAGNPGSNPKDMEFFQEIKKIPLKTAKICAFGATRRKDITCNDCKLMVVFNYWNCVILAFLLAGIAVRLNIIQFNSTAFAESCIIHKLLSTGWAIFCHDYFSNNFSIKSSSDL